MIGFTVGNWSILPQVRKIKGVEVSVACKPHKYRPYEDKITKETKFAPLAHWTCVVLLGDRRAIDAEPVQVKLCLFSESIKDDDGKRIGVNPDVISGMKLIFPKLAAETKPFWTDPVFERDKKVKPSAAQSGREMFFSSLDNARDELVRRYGEAMAEIIMCLLLDEFNGVGELSELAAA